MPKALCTLPTVPPHPPVTSVPGGDSSLLAAVAAHQVRGPLTCVRLRLELLEDQLLDTAQPAACHEVRGVLNEVDRLSQVLDQILAWSAVGRRTGAPLEPVDVLAVATARVNAWSASADARGATLDLDGAVATGVSTPGSLEQVLDVLLDNALHVTPESGRILVRVNCVASQVRVEVCDQGPGMSGEQIVRACEPFWRGESGRSRKGTGLGLTIASALLSTSGGRLELSRAQAGGLRAVAVLPQLK